MAHRMLAFAAAAVAAATTATAAPAQPGGIDVTNAWARATPGKVENGAAYATLVARNGDRLTAVSTPLAGKAELHAMKMEGGVMTMAPLAAIDLPAGQPVTLKPGGIHIMLLGLKQPLQPGQSLPLILHFEKGGAREVAAAVGKAGATAPESHAGGAAGAHAPSRH